MAIDEIQFKKDNGRYSLYKGVIISNDNDLIYSQKNNNSKEAEILFDKPINRINEYAFYHVNNIPRLVFKDVKSIGRQAFGKMNGLETLILPKTIDTIDDIILESTKVKRLQIPFVGKSRTELKDMTYLYGKDYQGFLPEYFYLSSQADIDKYPFKNTNLEHIVLSNQVKEIKKKSFEGTPFVKRIVIPESVETIESLAFYKCGGKTLDIYVKEQKVGFNKGLVSRSILLGNVVIKKANLVVDPKEYWKYREEEMKGFIENE